MFRKCLAIHLPYLPSSWFIALGFLLGNGLALKLEIWLPPELLLLLAFAALSLAIRRYWLLAGLISGFVGLLVFLAGLMAQAPGGLDTEDSTFIQGQIKETRQPQDGLASIVLKVNSCQRPSGERCTLATGSLVRLNWYPQQALPGRGETWELETRLRKIRSMHNFAAADFTGIQLARALVARGYVPDDAQLHLLEPAQGLAAWRQQLLKRLDAADLHPQGRNFFLALALGEHQALLPEDWQLLEKTGTLHLWVVSGLHLGMLAGLVLWLARRYNWPWVPALLLAFVLAWGYAELAGWGVAAQRATFMLGLGALLLSGWRQLSPWTLLSLALLGVLVLNPLQLLTRGFWLSFGAVALLFFALRGLKTAPAWQQLLRVQWVIALGMTPLLLWQGAEFSLWAPLVNLLMVPLVGLLLLPLSLLSLMLVGLLNITGLAEFSSFLFALAYQLLRQFAELPSLTINNPTWLWLGLLGLFPPGFPGRLFAPLGLLLAFLPSSLPTSLKAADITAMDWQVRVFDVGQGTAVLVQSQDQRLLYDTGRGFLSGWAPVLPALEPWVEHKKPPLQQLVISHEDNDHAGGLPFLLQRDYVEQLRAPRLLFSKQMFSKQTTVAASVPEQQPCHAGENWVLGALDVIALWPPQAVTERVGNTDSCVLLIRGAGHSLLLTGDAGVNEEAFFSQALAQLLQNQPLTLLLTGHHGSATSTSRALLDAARPQIALHSAGWGNRYGHPSSTVVDRLYQAGVRQYTTAEQGALFIELHPNQPPQVITWQDAHRPLWSWLRHKP